MLHCAGPTCSRNRFPILGLFISAQLRYESTRKLLMPTLLLTPRQTEDAQQLWRACARLGWDVHRVHNWKVSAVNPVDVAVYAEPLLATHIAQTLGIEILEPQIACVPSVPETWRKRSVLLAPIEEDRGGAQPRFVKTAAGKKIAARAYASGK